MVSGHRWDTHEEGCFYLLTVAFRKYLIHAVSSDIPLKLGGRVPLTCWLDCLAYSTVPLETSKLTLWRRPPAAAPGPAMPSVQEELMGILILKGYSYWPPLRVNPALDTGFSLIASAGNTVWTT